MVGVLSLALGAWTVLSDTPALGLAAGLLGLVAGLIALVSSPEARTAAAPEATLAAAAPGAREVPEPVIPSTTELLTDPETELFSEAYLRVALDSRLASARRHLRPVAVAVMEVAEGVPDDPTSTAPPARVAEAIRETVREADIACRMQDGTFAVILEDTPENGAVWTVERIRRNLVSRFGHHTLWAGVACYPAHAFDSDELLAQVHEALQAAKEWRQDRIEVATAD